MTSLTHPSVDFPGPPTVTLEVPDGWEPVHRPGLLLAAKLPREGRFAPNIVVGVEACPPGFSTEEPMGRMRELARSRAGQASQTYAAALGEHEFVGVRFGGQLFQNHPRDAARLGKAARGNAELLPARSPVQPELVIVLSDPALLRGV